MVRLTGCGSYKKGHRRLFPFSLVPHPRLRLLHASCLYSPRPFILIYTLVSRLYNACRYSLVGLDCRLAFGFRHNLCEAFPLHFLTTISPLTRTEHSPLPPPLPPPGKLVHHRRYSGSMIQTTPLLPCQTLVPARSQSTLETFSNRLPFS